MFFLSWLIRYLFSLKVNWIDVGKLPIIINRGVYIILFAKTSLGNINRSNDLGKKHEMGTMKDETKNANENKSTYCSSNS